MFLNLNGIINTVQIFLLVIPRYFLDYQFMF